MENQIEELLRTISGINERYEKMNSVTGVGFNIFEILNLETNKSLNHSTFIKALLDPKGNHGLGDKMLKLFLTTINFYDLDLATAIVYDHEGIDIKVKNN